MVGDEANIVVERRALGQVVDGEERNALELDPPAPCRAGLGEHRPRDRVLRRPGIQVCADQPCPVGLRAAQREVHPPAHVVRPPVRHPVDLAGVQRPGEAAVRVRCAGPDMALVEMGVDIREGGEDQAVVEIGARNRRTHRSRGDGGDATIGDDDVGCRVVRLAGRRSQRRAEREWNRCPHKPGRPVAGSQSRGPRHRVSAPAGSHSRATCAERGATAGSAPDRWPRRPPRSAGGPRTSAPC